MFIWKDILKILDGVILQMDGDKICATKRDFINLQESPAGFGNTIEEALDQLMANIDWNK